ncbi:hypothetical protein CapIbe_008526, partial [Capra ibex]
WVDPRPVSFCFRWSCSAERPAMLVFFPIISPLILGPEMISHGVRFKEMLIKRFFSPMTAKIKYLSPLGEEVKSMSTWESQTDTLKDTGDLLKGQMPDVIPEKHTDKGSGPLTLQARMTCWREGNGHTSASWEFGFNGQLCLLFDSKNVFWTMVHSKGRQMKQKWGNDRGVTDFFRTVYMGDCQAWLRDFMVRWEKMLKTSASPTTGPPTVKSSATAIKHITWILPMLLTSFVITVFLG